MDDLDRFLALQRRLLERLSTSVEPFEHGTVYLDDEYRSRYDSNFLSAEGTLDGVDAATLAGAADRILGGAGYAHREVAVSDDAAGERLAPGFKERGYYQERNAVMVLRRGHDRAPDLGVEELSFAEVRPLIAETYRRVGFAETEELVRLFTNQHGKGERVIGARFFAARVDGALAGDCTLFVDGTDAQVEFVDTLEEYRGRGVARAVVLRAIEAAHEAGAEHVFIIADDDDWPKKLYERLGFDRLARTWSFIRKPED